MRLLGAMASCIAIVPPARLNMRPLQQYLMQQWSHVKGQLQDLVLISCHICHSVQWWNSKNLL